MPKAPVATSLFTGRNFVLGGSLNDAESEELANEIKKQGGGVVKRVTKTTYAVLCKRGDDGATTAIKSATKLGVDVLSSGGRIGCSSFAFLISSIVLEYVSACIKAGTLAKFGAFVVHKSDTGKMEIDDSAASSSSSASGSSTLPSAALAKEEKKVKLQIKGKAAVDPYLITLGAHEPLTSETCPRDSGLADDGEIVSVGKDVYNTVMTMADVTSNLNSFYKLQVIKARGRFHLFRAWGRVGTTFGGNKVEPFGSQQNAIDAFCALFLVRSIRKCRSFRYLLWLRPSNNLDSHIGKERQPVVPSRAGAV